ncbi:MAG: carboxypeptidase regulatory-like domain-containing protein [Candidatus Hydrogenedentes bacterium]|nr:carboxypeptidase regulatory-like domain-containing protein [Candidatus Hydrogenedentota bacterium]
MGYCHAGRAVLNTRCGFLHLGYLVSAFPVLSVLLAAGAFAEDSAPQTGAENSARYAFQGTVYDDRGLPVPGTAVAITRVSWGPYSADICGEANQETISDAAGRFRFGNLLPGGYDVVAYTGDRAGYGAHFLSPPGAPIQRSGADNECDVWLKPFGSISGTIRTTAGEPLSGARVGLAQTQEEVGPESGKARIVFAAPLYTVTEKDGVFTLRYIVGRKLRLYAYYPGCSVGMSDWVSPGTTDAKIEIGNGGGITGQLVDGETGKPLPDTPIVTMAPAREHHGMTVDTHTTRTDKDGYFSFENLMPGTHELRIPNAHPIRTAAPLGAVVVNEGENAVANLRTIPAPTGAVSGRVYDGDTGKGVGGVTVGIPLPVDRYAVTNADGRYVLSALESKVQQVRYYSPPGYPEAPMDGVRVQVRADEIVQNVDFVLHAGRRIFGQLIAPDGKPYSEGSVTGYAADQRVSSVGRSNPGVVYVNKEGQFVLAGFQPGERIRLSAHRGEHFIVEEDKTLIQGGPAEVVLPETGDLTDVKVTLQAYSVIHGIVLDANGTPVAGATVSATVPPFQTPPTPVKSREKGEFGFGKLPGGHYVLRASAQGKTTPLQHAAVVGLRWGEYRDRVVVYIEPPANVATAFLPPQQPLSPPYVPLAPLSAPVSAVAAAPKPVEQPKNDDGKTISGRVTDSQGKPLYNMDVIVDSPQPNQVLLNANTDPDGRYSITGVPEGSYNVVISSHEFEYSAKEKVPAGSANVDFRLVRRGENIKIRGTVIDAVTKKPITDFDAGLASPDARDPAKRMSATRWIRMQSPQGILELAEVNYILGVRATGYASQFIELSEKSLTSLTVALEPEHIIEGRVLNSAGAPVADAIIHSTRHRTSPERIIWIAATPSGIARSDAQGRFRMVNLGSADLLVAASHPDYACTVATLRPSLMVANAPDVAPSTSDIVMSNGCGVTGVIRENGKALAGENVILASAKLRINQSRKQPADPDPMAGPFGPVETTTRTNASGQFAFQSFPVGDAHLEWARLEPGPGPQRALRLFRDLKLEEGRTFKVDLDVPTEFTALEGRTAIKGEPIDGYVEVTVTRDGGDYSTSTRAGKDGRYGFSKLPSGKATLKVSARTKAAQHAVQRAEVDLRPREVAKKDINFDMAPLTYTLSGARDSETVLVVFLPGSTTTTLDNSDYLEELEDLVDNGGLSTRPDPKTPWTGEITPGTYTVIVLAWPRETKIPEMGKSRSSTKTVEIEIDKNNSVELTLP